MAKQQTEQQKQAAAFRKEIEPALKEAGAAIGEVQAAVTQYIESELAIGEAATGAISELIGNHVWGVLSELTPAIDDTLAAVAQHIGSELAFVGEQTECVALDCKRTEFPDVTGLIKGTDTRSPDEKAADPLGGNTCGTGSVPPYSPPLPTPPPPLTPSTPPAEPYKPISAPPAPTEPKTLAPTFAAVPGCDVDRYGEAVSKSLSEAINGAFGGGSLGTLVDAIWGVLTFPVTATVKATVGAGMGAFLNVLGAFVDQLATQVKAGIQGEGCDSDEMGAIISAEAVIKAVNLLGGVIPPQIWQPLEYRRNMLCPVEYPTATEALQCYLAGTISEKTVQTWLQQNNKCFEPQKKLIKAARSRANPTELAMQRLRKIIGPSQYNKEMRDLGWLIPDEIDDIFKLTQQIPPITDLLRFMVRDTADERAVAQFNLDGIGNSAFEKKWTGKLKEWGEMQGIPEDYARYAWRAHWRWPAPGQLYEMLHRLSRLPDGDPAKTTLDNVKEALIQDDIAPFWIDKFIAISYRPLTRVDVRRAYGINVLSVASVKEAYLDSGYDDKNAETLTQYTVKDRNLKIGGTNHIRLYKQEIRDLYTTRKNLIDDRYDPIIVDQAIDTAQKQMRGFSAVKLFSRQKISRQDAEVRLTAWGIPGETYRPWLDDVSRNYESSRPVRMFAKGSITRPEAEKRLTAWGIAPEIFKLWLDEIAYDKINADTLRRYYSNEITRVAAEAELQADGLPAAEIRERLDKIELRLRNEANMTCGKLLLGRFALGEFNEQVLRNELANHFILGQHADAMIAMANCRKAAEGKDPATSTLCEWLDQGWIQPGPFVDRLERVGWSKADALNILQTCTAKNGAARARQAAALANREAAAMEKERKRIAAQGKDIERQRAAMQRKSEQAAKAKDKREATLLKAADRLRQLIQVDLPDASIMVRVSKRRLQEDSALSIDEAIAAVVLAIESGDFTTPDGYENAVDQAAIALLAQEEDLPVPQLSLEPSSNGSTNPPVDTTPEM